MKANMTNLRKALKACAKAHNAKYENWETDGQIGIKSETPATICDVRMICEAFFGPINGTMAVEPGYGYTTIWLRPDFAPVVDENLLYLALPYGTTL